MFVYYIESKVERGASRERDSTVIFHVSLTDRNERKGVRSAADPLFAMPEYR